MTRFLSLNSLYICFIFAIKLSGRISNGFSFQSPPTSRSLLHDSLQSGTAQTLKQRQVAMSPLYGSTPSRPEKESQVQQGFFTKSSLFLVSLTLMTTLALPMKPQEALAYQDYASETVQEAVKLLKDAGGNSDQIFRAYENIAEIISEGKGVGGMINYQGIELDRGYVADEDTSIYNPGLTLLTEGEKTKIVNAVIDSRKLGLSKAGQWSENNELAFQELKEKLDPYHMVELKGYLGIVPIYSAALYLVVFAVQQFARDLFPLAYVGAAVAIFGPAIVLVLAGPQ